MHDAELAIESDAMERPPLPLPLPLPLAIAAVSLSRREMILACGGVWRCVWRCVEVCGGVGRCVEVWGGVW